MLTLWARVPLLAVAAALASCAAGSGIPSATGALALRVERRPETGAGTPSPLLELLAQETSRAMSELSSAGDPPVYFVAYQVTDRRAVSIQASFGGLRGSEDGRTRTLDVDVRVGTPAFDNTHPARGSDLLVRSSFDHPSWQLPLEDDPAMLLRTLWVGLDTQYRRAVEEFVKIRGNITMRAQSERSEADFTQEPPLVFAQEPQALEVDRAFWEAKVREYSALFREDPAAFTSTVQLRAEETTRFLVNSEGSRVQVSRTHARLSIFATTRSEDGMDLQRYEDVELSLDPSLPEDAEIRRRIASVLADVRALRNAPQATPFVGPAILEGTAAGVFAHEVLGHRVEGHRQKSDDEGQTFAAKVGERVMPRFIDIYDDPGIASLNGTLLNGYYAVDDEAVRPRRSSIIDGGVLRGFLLSRSPIDGFDRSNGHGRRQEGFDVVARQGNLIVHPRTVVPAARLRQLLQREIRRQGKPYGLRFAVVEGGYTNTSRSGIQAFRVSPVMVYKVFPDGREELIRGASIDGTPLASLSQILAAGDDVRVFNGFCGAESGSVPVSAVSPSLLLARVEISGVSSTRSRQPVLPPPPAGIPSGDRRSPALGRPPAAGASGPDDGETGPRARGPGRADGAGASATGGQGVR